MSHLILSAELTAIFTLCLGLIVLLSDAGCRLNQIFALYSLSISLWSFCFSQLHEVPSSGAILWGRLLHAGCILIPVLFAHFTVVLAGQYERYKQKLFVAYIIAATYNLFNLYPGIFTSEIVYRSGYAYPRPIGFFYFSYFLFFVGLATFSLITLWHTSSHLPKETSRWLRAFSVLTAGGYLGGMNNFLIMIDLQLFPLFPYGLYMVVLYAAASSFILTKHLSPLRRIPRYIWKQNLLARGELPR